MWRLDGLEGGNCLDGSQIWWTLYQIRKVFFVKNNYHLSKHVSHMVIQIGATQSLHSWSQKISLAYKEIKLRVSECVLLVRNNSYNQVIIIHYGLPKTSPIWNHGLCVVLLQFGATCFKTALSRFLTAIINHFQNQDRYLVQIVECWSHP